MDKAGIITTISKYEQDSNPDSIVAKFQAAAKKELEKGKKL